jgi:hypothetical protein
VNDPTYPVQTYDELRAALRDGVERLIAERSRRRRTSRTLGIACAALLLLSGLALAATSFVGSPAPTSVQSDIAAVDAGMPAALQLNPDVRNARSVASTGASTLWLADLARGGRCLELTTTYYPSVRAAGCATGSELDATPISATMPNDDRAGSGDPVVIAGHVQPPGAATLSLQLADGRTVAVPFGAQHFYVVDLTGADAVDVRAHGVALVAEDAAGAEIARTTVPADWDSSAADAQGQTTIDVTTRSAGSDLTKVLGIDGVFRDPTPASLQLVYGDGAVAEVPLEPDGSFHYDVPRGRQGDFMTPQRLVGRDAQGRVVADRPVAAVAYWRGRAPA